MVLGQRERQLHVRVAPVNEAGRTGSGELLAADRGHSELEAQTAIDCVLLPALGDVVLWAGPTSLVIGGLNLVDLDEIAIIGSAGFLVVFAAVNAAAYRLGPAIGARRVVTGTATLACVRSTRFGDDL